MGLRERRDHERLAVGWQQLRCYACHRWSLWIRPDSIAKRALDFIDDGWERPEWEDFILDADACLERSRAIQLFRHGWESGAENAVYPCPGCGRDCVVNGCSCLD